MKGIKAVVHLEKGEPMIEWTYGEWTPVDEKLPYTEEWVIVTIKDTSGDTPYTYTDFGWYFDRADCWIIDAEPRTDVIAWMQLPSPYTGRENQ